MGFNVFLPWKIWGTDETEIDFDYLQLGSFPSLYGGTHIDFSSWVLPNNLATWIAKNGARRKWTSLINSHLEWKYAWRVWNGNGVILLHKNANDDMDDDLIIFLDTSRKLRFWNTVLFQFIMKIVDGEPRFSFLFIPAGEMSQPSERVKCGEIEIALRLNGFSARLLRPVIPKIDCSYLEEQLELTGQSYLNQLSADFFGIPSSI